MQEEIGLIGIIQNSLLGSYFESGNHKDYEINCRTLLVTTSIITIANFNISETAKKYFKRNKKNMKILIINYRFHFTGGPERYMFNVIKEFEKRGHEIINFSVKNKKNVKSDYEKYFPRNIDNSNEFLFEKFKRTPLFYYDFLSRQFYSFYIKKKLDRLIKDTNPDICYLLPHSGSLSPSVIDALKKNNIPVIHRISDYNIICPQGGLYRQRKFCNQCKVSKVNVIKNKCIKNSYIYSTLKYASSVLHDKLKLYDKVDHYITTNDFARNQFIEFGFESEKITTIETFTDKLGTSKIDDIQYPINFLYIGNIDDSKGAYDLIEAVKELSKLYNEEYFTLNIYGGLRDYERVKVNDFILKNKLGNIIHLNGVVSPEKVSTIYQDSDVTVIPARWAENLPNVLIESLSNGAPIVVPNFGSFAATVNDSVAYFYKPHEVLSLKDALMDIIKNPITIKEKSEMAIKYANSKFNKNNHISSLITLFEKYLN